ncbi:hypothetical protein AX15_000168 [Amanita polypyramis BW_CC]|nr:hypothetical protein AX15_000168 [Amanita polypyramis BW_CC]
MPLDGHSFLVAQGWAGKGSGLREGAISRPLAIPQKRTLAGVGKDRDEAFPFWDHLFSAAAKSIQLKIHNSDSEDEPSDNEANEALVLSRTSTGILSNRRPATGASIRTSGTSTPAESQSNPRYSLLVTAKREAAKQNLYSRFFRGPVLGPDIGLEQERTSTTSDSVESGDVPIALVPQLDTGNGDGGDGKEVGGRKRNTGKEEEGLSKKKRKRAVKENGGEENSIKKKSRQGGENRNERKKRKQQQQKDATDNPDALENTDEECSGRKPKKQHALTLDDEMYRKQSKGKVEKNVELNPTESNTFSQGTVDHRKKRRWRE